MRVIIEKSKSDKNIWFFHHKYRVNSKAFTREERAFMRENNIKPWGSSTLPWCGYADDLVLFLVSALSLQKAVELLDQVFSRFGLTINVSKTESMVLTH